MKTFKELPLHAVFYFGGAKWVKQSTRTAHRYGFPCSWFYFGLTKNVTQEKY